MAIAWGRLTRLRRDVVSMQRHATFHAKAEHMQACKPITVTFGRLITAFVLQPELCAARLPDNMVKSSHMYTASTNTAQVL